jgi:hypothetical protein
MLDQKRHIGAAVGASVLMGGAQGAQAAQPEEVFEQLSTPTVGKITPDLGPAATNLMLTGLGPSVAIGGLLVAGMMADRVLRRFGIKID